MEEVVFVKVPGERYPEMRCYPRCVDETDEIVPKVGRAYPASGSNPECGKCGKPLRDGEPPTP